MPKKGWSEIEGQNYVQNNKFDFRFIPINGSCITVATTIRTRSVAISVLAPPARIGRALVKEAFRAKGKCVTFDQQFFGESFTNGVARQIARVCTFLYVAHADFLEVKSHFS